MGALDAQEATVLRVAWGTMLQLTAFLPLHPCLFTFSWCMLILVAQG